MHKALAVGASLAARSWQCPPVYNEAAIGVPLEGRICAESNPGSALRAISTLMRGSSLERNSYSGFVDITVRAASNAPAAGWHPEYLL